MKKALSLTILFYSTLLNAQDYFHYGDKKAILDNGSIKREILLDNNKVVCSTLYLNGFGNNFVSKSKEFSFSVNS